MCPPFCACPQGDAIHQHHVPAHQRTSAGSPGEQQAGARRPLCAPLIFDSAARGAQLDLPLIASEQRAWPKARLPPLISALLAHARLLQVVASVLDVTLPHETTTSAAAGSIGLGI